MKITCQTCQSKYTVSDEKVQGKTVKIKCRKCGATILVNSSGVTTNGSTGDGSAAAADAGGLAQGSFLVNVTDSDQRSMSLKEIVDAYQSSLINAETYVWADGMSDWTPLGQVEQIVAQLQTASSTPKAASAPPAAAAAAPRAAARKDAGKRADVFSGGAQAQTEVAAAAPAAGNLLRATPTKADENSVLFSLSALTARVGGAAAPQTAGSASTKEDSGLIDLKALASGTGPSASPAAGLVSDTVGLFPLGLPAAPAVAAPIAIPEAPPKNRAPLFIALGSMVAVVAIIGAFLFMKESGKPPPTDPNAALSVAPPPQAELGTRPPPEPVATATASASASAVAAKPPPRWTGGKAPVKSGTTSGGSTATTGGDKPPPKPSGGCGCAPGDLMCAMKCSTKK